MLARALTLGLRLSSSGQWTPKIVDVRFTDATLSLFEDGALSDQVTVPVSS